MSRRIDRWIDSSFMPAEWGEGKQNYKKKERAKSAAAEVDYETGKLENKREREGL